MKEYIYVSHQEGTSDTVLGIGRTNNVSRRHKEHNTSKAVLKIQFIKTFERGVDFECTDVEMENYLHETFSKKRDPKMKEIFHHIDLDKIKSAINEKEVGVKRPDSFKMRPEQKECHDKFVKQFKVKNKAGKKCFMDAKMRFGKVFTSLQIAKTMKAKKVLCITFRPAVADSWRMDIENHVDFTGIDFVDLRKRQSIPTSPNMQFAFASIQGAGKIGDDTDEDKDDITDEELNKWAFLKAEKFDLLIVDEFHEGTDTARTKKMLALITAKKQLWLSGTALRAKKTGIFSADQTFSWTYLDEQRAKANWPEDDAENNPYSMLPSLEIYAVSLTKAFKDASSRLDSFDSTLSNLFSLNDSKDGFQFRPRVRQFLSYLVTKDNAVSPFNIAEMDNSIWFLPTRVKIIELLKEEIESMSEYDDYKVILATTKGVTTVTEQHRLMNIHKKTITLSVGTFTTGVTVPKWSSVLMLHDGGSDMAYLQSIFRGQSPNVADNKIKCYAFDYKPARMLETIMHLARKDDNDTAEQISNSMKELLTYLPVFIYDGSGLNMVRLDELSFEQEYYSRLDIKEMFNKILIDDFSIQGLSDEILKNFSDDRYNDKSEKKAEDKKDKKSSALTSSTSSNTTKSDDTKKDKIIKNIKKFFTYIPRFLFLSPDEEQSVADLRNTASKDAALFKELTSQDPGIIDELIPALVSEDALDRIIKIFNSRVNAIVHDASDKDFASKLMNAMQLLQYFPSHANKEKRTPWDTAEEMIYSTISDEKLNNDKIVILEPMAGNGTFIYSLFIRMFRLPYWIEKYPDEVNRADKILGCLYFNDIKRRYTLTVETLLTMVFEYTDKNGNIDSWYNYMERNGSTKNFLTKTITDMKIDIIIGNPPYQENSGGNNAKAIYQDFIEHALSLSNDVIMITPSRWMRGGMNLNKFRKKVTDGTIAISEIKHRDNSKLFLKATIKGGASWAVYHNTYLGKTIFNGVEVDLTAYDVVFIKGHALVYRLSGYKKLDVDMFRKNDSGVASNGRIDGTDKDAPIKWEDSPAKGLIPIRVTTLLGHWKYIDVNLIKDKYPITKWKTAIPKSNDGKGTIPKVLILKPNEVSSETFLGWVSDTEDEAESLKSYLNTAFTRFMFSLRQSGININPDNFAFIPQVPLDRTWDDDAVAEYFDLTDEEQALYR